MPVLLQIKYIQSENIFVSINSMVKNKLYCLGDHKNELLQPVSECYKWKTFSFIAILDHLDWFVEKIVFS